MKRCGLLLEVYDKYDDEFVVGELDANAWAMTHKDDQIVVHVMNPGKNPNIQLPALDKKIKPFSPLLAVNQEKWKSG